MSGSAMLPMLGRWIAVAVLALATSAAAKAADDCDFDSTQYLSDWHGVRQRLYCDLGIDILASYLGEAAGNPTGGERQGVRYAHEIDFGADLDLGRLLHRNGSNSFLDGVTFHLLFAEFAGRSLTDDRIGNLFEVQEVFDGEPDVRLAGLSLAKKITVPGDPEVKLDMKVGWIATGDDFALIGGDALPNLGISFQSAAIAPNPGALLFNSGFTVSPFPSWGGVAKIALQSFYLQAGAYEVNPTLFEQGNGFKLGLSGATGAFVPIEVGWKGDNPWLHKPGQFVIGGYYDSSDVDDVVAQVDAETPPGVSHGRWGIYLLGEQTIYQEPRNETRGLTVFGGLEIGDPHTAELPVSLQAGLIYQGTFKGRNRDTIDLSVSTGWVNSRVIHAQKNANQKDPGSTVVQSAETIVELNYGCQVIDGFVLRPGLQFVINPGANDHVPTAVVLDLQSSLKF